MISNPKTSINITQEDAIVEYTGQTLQATESSKSSLATIQLTANIQDITELPKQTFEKKVTNLFSLAVKG